MIDLFSLSLTMIDLVSLLPSHIENWRRMFKKLKNPKINNNY